ncbi:hypothetical protein HPB52_024320 [Rhipicephalus sanguineus]|uniref:Uncharacterized protein n=1 Tax=Rhipicephalus sanguineus TaxID=34632 RepID=A0A9D4PB47_RHISA|nr:hypothetical protein HPB52_024320 [Rhipicephalus sanguineus]
MLSEILRKVIPADIVVHYYKRDILESGSVLTAANSPESSEQEMERLLEFLRIEVECRERSAQITAPHLMKICTHDNQSSRKIAPPPSAAKEEAEAVERHDKTMRQHKKDRHAEEIAEDKRSEEVIREASMAPRITGV